ncbi:MAG: hypothetical protein Q7U28_06670 [Aquabacterium sp.]|nr:hypothetical protein [Aquabacterium sp.]
MNLIKIKVVRELCLKGENFQPGAIVPVALDVLVPHRSDRALNCSRQ